MNASVCSFTARRSRSQEYSDNLGKVGLIIWKKWRYLQCPSPSGCASTCSWNVVTTPTILTVAAFFAALTIGLVWAFNVALLACKNNRERTTLKHSFCFLRGRERETKESKPIIILSCQTTIKKALRHYTTVFVLTAGTYTSDISSVVTFTPNKLERISNLTKNEFVSPKTKKPLLKTW